MPSSVIQFFQPNRKATAIHFLPSIPEEDSYLVSQFSYRSLAERKENKKALLQMMGKEKDQNTKPLIVVIADLFRSNEEKKLLEQVLCGIKEIEASVLILATKVSCSHALLAIFLQIDINEKNLHQALAAGDIILLPNHCNPEITQACHAYGIVPIAASTQNSMSDYNPVEETGNCFTYQSNSTWSMFAAVVRALETFKLPYDWQRIQKNGMEQ